MTDASRMRRLLAAAVLAAAWAIASPTLAAPRPTDLVKADLVAEPAAVQAGQPFWVALRLRMKEHWHTYWRNPGDSGLPTEIKWSLPPGFSAGEIVWPTPSRLPVGPLMNFGYDGEAVLLTRINPPADLPAGSKVAIAGKANWLVCEKECVPGDAELSLTLPVGDPVTSQRADAASAGLFKAARAALPAALPGKASAAFADKTMTLTVDGLPAEARALGSAFFFPIDDSLIDNAGEQRLVTGDGKLSLAIPRSDLSSAPPKSVAGVLVATDTGGVQHAWALDTGGGPSASAIAGPAAETSAGQAPAARAPPPAQAAVEGEGLTLLSAVLLAFLGGLVLNLMPCVFPVLSIKVLALANSAGETPAHMRRHGLAYGAGVLVAFGALAALLLVVRQAGTEVGWGFQLQSPPVVAALAYVMLAMGLAMSGAIHVGASFTGLGDDLTRRAGLSGSFFTGVLASVVASPCTGPFMAAAVGFALLQSGATAMAIFLALGLGLALPFVLLTFSPTLLRRMPRPGLWMDRLKQALAFPLYATAAWLIWVLAQQVTPAGLFAALGGLILVALAVWLIGIAGLSRGGGALTSRGLALATVAGLAFVIGVVGENRLGASDMRATTERGGAEPFTQARLDQLLADGRPVFINMTAAWCITCMVNERVALGTAAVQNALKVRNIAYLKGDWTNQNPEITRILERYGRGGVPLYLLYTRGDEPVVLPQVLTPGGVLAEFARVRTRAAQEGPAGSAPGPSSTF